MSREIKFRAWDTRKKVMYSAEEMGQDQLTLSVDGRGFINVSGTSTKLSTFPTHIIPMQSTGLKDKNGVEIYEGDIVTFERTDSFPSYNQAVIVWSNEMASFLLSYTKPVNPKGLLANSYCMVSEDKTVMFGLLTDWGLKIIGNIHTTPQLLEDK